MSIWHIDFETRSRADLTEIGAFKYAQDPSTEVMCLAVKRDDGPTLVWIPPEFEVRDALAGDTVSDAGARELLDVMLADDGPLYAFNAQFEFVVFRYVMPRYGFAEPDLKRWRCAQVMARRANIPASLGKAAATLALKNQKDAAGGRLINTFSIPQKDTGGFIQPYQSPGKWHSFVEYCRQDVETEHEMAHVLNPFDLGGWLLDTFHIDLVINDRGMPVNMTALRNANEMIDDTSVPAFEEFNRLTGLNPTQNAKLRVWFAENGLQLDNLQSDTLAELDVSTLPETPGQAIALLRKIGFAAVKKIKTMIECAGDDGFIRGSLQFYGAAATGRWSGRLHQPQNFKRPEFDGTEEMYDHVCNGASKEFLELWYGKDIFSILASSIRHFIHDPQGPMFSADYSAIEARVLAWLAGEEWKLEVFRTHGKIYEMNAEKMFKVPMEQVDKSLRQKSKVSELACIAEGQLVTTDHGLVPIERVTKDMLVWDGISFVEHGGLWYQGIKEVITYEGLTATKDHIVFTVSGESQFGEAARRGEHLRKSSPSWKSARDGESAHTRPSVHQAEMEGCVRSDGVPKLRKSVMAKLVEFIQGHIQRVSALFSPKKTPCLAFQEGHVYEAAVREPIGQWLQKLWGSWDKVQVCESDGGMRLDSRKHRPEPEHGARPHQQRWSLRGGKLSVRNKVNAELELSEGYAHTGGVRMDKDEESLRAHDERETCKGAWGGGDDSYGENSSGEKVQELGSHPSTTTRARVYDILNCGPRNRFTVSGVLVHNCGYGGSVNALIAMGALDMGLQEEELQSLVDAWREANPNIVKFWYACSNAAISAVNSPGEKFFAGKVAYFCGNAAKAKYLFCVLPSGRRLAYRDPQVKSERRVSKRTGNEYTQQVLTCFGQLPGAAGTKSQKWGQVYLSPGLLAENGTQSTAFDLMANGVLKAEAKGYRSYSLIHDEVLAAFDGPHQSLAEFQACLEDTPPWAAGLPLGTSGEIVKYYTK